MSFFLLLLVLSLLVIMPAMFIISAKRNANRELTHATVTGSQSLTDTSANNPIEIDVMRLPNLFQQIGNWLISIFLITHSFLPSISPTIALINKALGFVNATL